jgi:hypothetical protein
VSIAPPDEVAQALVQVMQADEMVINIAVEDAVFLDQ